MSFPIDPEKSGFVLPEDRDYGVQKEVENVMATLPDIQVVGSDIMQSWNGEDDVRLDKVLIDVAGYYPVVRQMIGDCVSFGWGKAIMLTLAADIVIRGENEKWPGAEICTEWIYGTSRVVAGRGRLGNSDGSVGIWAAASVDRPGQGTLLRKSYEAGGKSFDLSSYSGRRAKSWGYRGLPLRDLEPIADENPVSAKPALIRNFQEAADAIANGYGIAVCSNQGFKDVRDRDGFLVPYGRWAHCMCFFAVKGGRRRGLGCDNSSWADWVSGPNPDDLPTGCGWVDERTVNKMLSQGDTFAVPGYEGFADREGKFLWTPFG